jgi:hypothetical protein
MLILKLSLILFIAANLIEILNKQCKGVNINVIEIIVVQ